MLQNVKLMVSSAVLNKLSIAMCHTEANWAHTSHWHTVEHAVMHLSMCLTRYTSACLLAANDILTRRHSCICGRRPECMLMLICCGGCCRHIQCSQHRSNSLNAPLHSIVWQEASMCCVQRDGLDNKTVHGIFGSNRAAMAERGWSTILSVSLLAAPACIGWRRICCAQFRVQSGIYSVRGAAAFLR